jgi:SOS-response transcriptional repressor LexA
VKRNFLALTLKEFVKTKRDLLLVPINPDLKPLEIDDPSELQILGVVTDLIHRSFNGSIV